MEWGSWAGDRVSGEGDLSLSRLPDILYHENLVITKAEDSFISSSIHSGLLCRTLSGQFSMQVTFSVKILMSYTIYCHSLSAMGSFKKENR